MLLATVLLAGTSPAGEPPPGTGQEGTAVTKLIFIHHSVGGNWLAHDYGGLVSALNRNGFYVNDITYGWQPEAVNASWTARATSRMRGWFNLQPTGADRIGDRTDIGQLYDWFIGPDATLIMDAVYHENNETTDFGPHDNARSAAPLANPGIGIENEIVMIKPCYPNSIYLGHGTDAATPGPDPPRNFMAASDLHTVANCKRSPAARTSSSSSSPHHRAASCRKTAGRRASSAPGWHATGCRITTTPSATLWSSTCSTC